MRLHRKRRRLCGAGPGGGCGADVSRTGPSLAWGQTLTATNIRGPENSDKPDPIEAESKPRISRRRLFVVAAGLVLGTAGALRLVQGFGGFRINEVEAATPVFDPQTWRLTVDGSVANPLSLSMDDLRALPA